MELGFHKEINMNKYPNVHAGEPLGIGYWCCRVVQIPKDSFNKRTKQGGLGAMRRMQFLLRPPRQASWRCPLSQRLEGDEGVRHMDITARVFLAKGRIVKAEAQGRGLPDTVEKREGGQVAGVERARAMAVGDALEVIGGNVRSRSALKWLAGRQEAQVLL